MIFKAQTTEVICSHQKSVTNIFPREGWYEQDPVEIINVVRECMEIAVQKLIDLGGDVRDIKAVGITNQRESTVVWDPESGESFFKYLVQVKNKMFFIGNPLHNCIIWSDIRNTSTVDQLLAKVPNKTHNKNYLKPLCGLPLSTYFSAVKLRWLLDNSQQVQLAIRNDKKIMFGTIDSWLIWNLTNGVHATDVTNASRTMLMNLETLQWDPILKRFFDIPENVSLPKIKASSEIYGEIHDGALKNVPISGKDKKYCTCFEFTIHLLRRFR